MLKKRKIKQKIKSKKGLTLVELVVGVTIVVIVFASCLGALVSGYTTTMYNSDQNKASSLNESLNDILISILGRMYYTDEDDVEELIDGIVEEMANQDGTISDSNSQAVVQLVRNQIPEIEFVAPEKDGENYVVHFPDGKSYQFSLIPCPTTTVSYDDPDKTPYSLGGVIVKTCFESASGPIIYESFVPFATS